MSGTLAAPRQGRYFRTLYSDVNGQFSLNGKALLVTDIDAINNQIINLVLTQIGERHFEPEFGSGVPNLLFDQPVAFTDWIMKDELFIAINRWLPHVQIDLNQSDIQSSEMDGSYYFHLVYSVRGLRGNLAVDFRLSI